MHSQTNLNIKRSVKQVFSIRSTWSMLLKLKYIHDKEK